MQITSITTTPPEKDRGWAEFVEAYSCPSRPRRDLLAEFNRVFGVCQKDVSEVIEADRLAVELIGGGVAWISPEDYDIVKGHRWYLSPNGRKGRNLKWYAARKEIRDGRETKVYLHRQLLGLTSGDGKTVDHVNGDPLDCTQGNLRVATAGQNAQNRSKQQGYGGRATSSPYKGVTRIKDRDLWIARIWKDGRHHFLGTFTEEKLAALAYDAKARELFGEFASPNADSFPELLTEKRA